MSEFQRSLYRNIGIGLVAASLCFLMYDPVLSNLSATGHSAYSYALLTTCCSASFMAGFASWSSDNDSSSFKYLIEGVRVVGITTPLTTLIGLLLFNWLGMGAGFISGLWLSAISLTFLGPDKPTDIDPEKNYFYERIHYFCTGFRIPAVIIPALAFGGLLLFEWWGLGAGFIAGSMISFMALTMWGPEKPTPPCLSPDQPSSVHPLASHHPHSTSSTHGLVNQHPTYPPTTFKTVPSSDSSTRQRSITI